ncbi:PEP-CTERM sorting domain-containing protein [Sedimentisphaera salicampi]|uniref:PEP-CTERM sorting domain-containing protein n=1 Tax=Sedimentisphaera salicampi TaxID=1941349 RepID=UPI000B9C9403|nr:PEP-CTERM sorting domain-containing protein [Sedimentisphaera salicampi]OXU15416.1 hypothetical protein SMSP1_00897 [Sedimentisphaera salicampi]
MKRFLVTAVFALACIQQAYSAGIIMNIYPEDGDVLATFSGSLDLTGFYDSGNAMNESIAPEEEMAMIAPSHPFVAVNPSGGITLTKIDSFESPMTSFGTNGLIQADSFSGSTLLLSHNEDISSQFISFDGNDINENNIVQVSGSAAFENSTVSGLGLNPGTYEINDSDFAEGENFTLTITPEPATLALLGLGGALIRKRRA